MYQLHIAEKRRKWNGQKVEDGETEEWVTTHDITVPDLKTLSGIMEALAAEIRGVK